jgi:hypothetical protein
VADILHGVVNQIGENFLQPGAIAEGVGDWLLHFDMNPTLLKIRLRSVESIVNQAGHVYQFDDFGGFAQLGQHQQALNHLVHVKDSLVDAYQEFVRFW